MKAILQHSIALSCLLGLFLLPAIGHGQILNAPEAAPNQTPPAGSTPWSAACASDSFNDYWVNFTWSPPLVNGDNEFILELSDAGGDFTNAVELARDGSKNAEFDFYFQFTIPPGTRGEGYQMRVRSTSPAMTSPASVSYPMYYLDVNSALTIRPQGQADFGDGTAEVCDGNTITLEVYNLGNANTYQYTWYRSGTPLTDNGPSITVSQSGMYNVEIDYGSCSGSGGTLSNIIDVTSGSSLGIAINPPTKTDLCNGETVDLIANITGQGLTYTWFKDGVAVSTPTIDDDTFTVDASVTGFEGDYQVEIFGPGACVERSAAVTITNAGDFTVTRDNPANMVVLPGQNVTLSVSTSASNPTYQWFRNGNPVSGATNNSIVVSDAEVGLYFARVGVSGGSCASSFVDSEQTSVVIPDSFEFVINYQTAYTPCAEPAMVLELGTINALDSGGNPTDVTADLLADFSYQWFFDGVAVSGATQETISLTDISENGSYELRGNLNSYTPVSNTLPLQLRVNETITVDATGTVACGPAEPITLSTSTDLSSASFDWFRDGVNLNLSTESIQITEAGNYQLIVQRSGCPVPSNEVTIGSLDPDLITFDPGDDIRIPEGTSRVVNASGADAYRWYDEANNLLSSSTSFSFTTEGNYLVIAEVGNCEVSRNIRVSYLDTFKVPNVISVNGDGINDQWIIPNSYSGKAEVNVIIYNDRGEEVFNEYNYQNNWPTSTTSFPKQNMVFYYKIKTDFETLKQGTITVIR